MHFDSALHHITEYNIYLVCSIFSLTTDSFHNLNSPSCFKLERSTPPYFFLLLFEFCSPENKHGTSVEKHLGGKVVSFERGVLKHTCAPRLTDRDKFLFWDLVIRVVCSFCPPYDGGSTGFLSSGDIFSFSAGWVLQVLQEFPKPVSKYVHIPMNRNFYV